MMDTVRDRPNDEFTVRGRLVLDRRLVRGALVVRDGHIAEIQRESRLGDLPKPVVEADIVAPGLIDLQVNGGFGVEVGDDPAAIRHLAAKLPATGVTAFLPTAISSPQPFYARVVDAFAAARDASGARPLGLHLEGPFLSPRRPGAHQVEWIDAADPAVYDDLLERDAIRLVTLAPERPGADELIRRLRAHGIVVSLGHTDATYDELIGGIDAGATMVTHLFNAMSPFQHRAPGAVGAALTDRRIIAGLIADGIHTDPAAIRLAVQAKGSSGIALVTDMMAAAGMPPGSYCLGGRSVIADGQSARLADGRLAGAVLTLDQAIRNVVAWTDLPVAQVITMATATPARVLGLATKGRLVVGADADLVLFDHELNVETTIVGAEVVYTREGL